MSLFRGVWRQSVAISTASRPTTTCWRCYRDRIGSREHHGRCPSCHVLRSWIESCHGHPYWSGITEVATITAALVLGKTATSK